jgi:hypothetical protein
MGSMVSGAIEGKDCWGTMAVPLAIENDESWTAFDGDLVIVMVK